MSLELAAPDLRRPEPKWVFQAFQAVEVMFLHRREEVSWPTQRRRETKGLMGWLARASLIAKVVATPVVKSSLPEVIAGTATAASKTQVTAVPSVAEVKMAGEKQVAVTGLSAEEVRAEAKQEVVRTRQGLSPAAATQEAALSRIVRTVNSDCCCYRKTQEAAGTWAVTAWAAEEMTMPAAVVGLMPAEGAPAGPQLAQRPSVRSIP